MDGFVLSSTGPDKPGDVWLTPKYIVDALGPFDLDPCASNPRPWDCAAENLDISQDGLAQDWGRNFVWMNPPYSNVATWMGALAGHGHGIALVFARTDTQWFWEAVWQRHCALLFIRSRLRFLNEKGEESPHGSASSASVLIGYGYSARDRMRNCGIGGRYLENNLPKD